VDGREVLQSRPMQNFMPPPWAFGIVLAGDVGLATAIRSRTEPA
jgi:hypothetical protein